MQTLRTEDRILAVLKKSNEPLKPSDIQFDIRTDYGLSIPVGTIYFRLRILVAEGKIERRGYGWYSFPRKSISYRNARGARCIAFEGQPEYEKERVRGETNHELAEKSLIDDEDPWAS